jgi:hypothetical protein
MSATVFESRPLPGGLAAQLRERLVAAHGEEPLSSVDPRGTIRRVAAVLSDLGCATVMYRGGLDLRGIEVDHVWLATGPGPDAPFVIDAAYPLFAEAFVRTLRRFVAGEVPAEALDAVASDAGVEARVLGEYPEPMRYLGRPVWSDRHSAGR